MLLKHLVLLTAASLALAAPGSDPLDARDSSGEVEKRGFCGKHGKFGMNCKPGGKCFDHEVNCCKGGNTYCEYGYYCIDDGKKCCPVGKWCPFGRKREEHEQQIASAVDAGGA